MAKFKIPSGVTRAFGKAGLQIKKHLPEILVVGGVIGGTASAVMACKATTKFSETVAKEKKELEQVHQYVEENGYTDLYTEQDHKKDLVVLYSQMGFKTAKLYGPAVGLGALSVAAILTGHNIMRKRNFALAAAYTSIDKSFKQYRERLVDRFGEDLDRELRYNIVAKEVEETVVNEKGEEETVKKTVQVFDTNKYSDYARCFTVGNVGYDDRDPEYSLKFLKDQQRYATEKLKAKGYLFLNEVYEMLGIPLTKDGALVGWVYNDKDPNWDGDNFVDFGIYNIKDENCRDFVNGREKSIWLDFNVDGIVYDLLK